MGHRGRRGGDVGAARRGRAAIGLTEDIWITCGARDGSRDAGTLKELRDELVERQGCFLAVMLYQLAGK